MVIELSRVKFGLKSYLWFQNQTSAQQEFDLKSQVWFQTKIARHEVQLPLYYFHFEIAEFSQYYWSKSWFVKKPKQKGFYISFCIRNRNDAIWNKNGAI